MDSQRPKSASCNPANSGSGFTLIEVMVALAIIAITLGALLSTSGSQAKNTAYLKHKSITHWVASYEMTQLQIGKNFPSTGDEKGSTEMAGHEWYWTRTTRETEDKDARNVEFIVYADRDRKQQVTNLTGLVTR